MQIVNKHSYSTTCWTLTHILHPQHCSTSARLTASILRGPSDPAPKGSRNKDKEQRELFITPNEMIVEQQSSLHSEGYFENTVFVCQRFIFFTFLSDKWEVRYVTSKINQAMCMFW